MAKFMVVIFDYHSHWNLMLSKSGRPKWSTFRLHFPSGSRSTCCVPLQSLVYYINASTTKHFKYLMIYHSNIECPLHSALLHSALPFSIHSYLSSVCWCSTHSFGLCYSMIRRYSFILMSVIARYVTAVEPISNSLCLYCSIACFTRLLQTRAHTSAGGKKPIDRLWPLHLH